MNKCVLPFIEYDFAVGKPCCMLSNYDHKKDFNTLLADHTANIKSTYCKSCWHHEKIGERSKRINHNVTFSKYLNVDKPILKSVVISTGNICNLYCVTCGVGNSTGWSPKQKFINSKNIKSIPKPTNTIKKKLLENINWQEIENVEFLGGETLYSKDLWEILEKLQKDTKISICTNGTIELDRWQFEKFQEFKNMHLTFSLDGIGKIFEYLRQPAKWLQVKKNIDIYIKNIGINNLGINITLSNMNIFYVDYIFLELAKIISKKHSYFFVENPQIFAVTNLTYEIGKIIEEKNPFFFSKHKINWAGTNQSMENFIENINLQDKFSNRFMKDYLPDFFQLMQKEIS